MNQEEGLGIPWYFQHELLGDCKNRNCLVQTRFHYLGPDKLKVFQKEYLKAYKIAGK